MLTEEQKKESRRETNKKYRQSEKGKEAIKRYNNSEKGKRNKLRYVVRKRAEKIQKERIEKEYFTKIAKEKPNKLKLYKKCYYTKKNRVLPLTTEEKKIRNRINSSILYHLHMLDPKKKEKKRERYRKSYIKNKTKYLINDKLRKREQAKKKKKNIIISFILYLLKIGYKIKKEIAIDYSVNSYVGLYKLKYERNIH